MSHSARILLVEDDVKLAQLVGEFLQREGFAVEHCARGDDAVARIKAGGFDVVILDLMLPGMDGLTVCREVRPHYDGAIVMLTAKGDEVDEVIGLELGADDYLAKPVRPRLLLARVKSLLRRSRSAGETGRAAGEEPPRLELGKLTIDATQRTVWMAGDPVEMTTAEFELLWFLAARAGTVVTRETIYGELRGIAYDGIDRSIDLRVARLRRKLGDDARHPALIKSVRGMGYLLVPDV